jgi:hypothetical protein
MASNKQLTLFEVSSPANAGSTSTFVDNMSLPVHRWFRYSAGFSAKWAEEVIREHTARGDTRVLDPFAGSATTLLAAEDCNVLSCGIESHPFVCRIARAKLARSTSAEAYRQLCRRILQDAKRREPTVDDYPPLVRKCYHDAILADLDRLRKSLEAHADSSNTYDLSWLTLVGILRRTSHVGTANWQYVLPRKSKKHFVEPFAAFDELSRIIYHDMVHSRRTSTPAVFIQGDARTCEGVARGFATLVITSPPYPNNFDYADATRLEMCFMKEIGGWGDLQSAVRQYLIRSCSQHVPEKSLDLQAILGTPELDAIRADITSVCARLSEVRLTKGGKKTYHLMVASYFYDLALVWSALRRVCDSPCQVCFVVGDSAPYGVYVPVQEWLGKLALAAGFRGVRFERIRDRNTKWKNRKHRVPLCEGRLWVEG